jgi:hypothetical protein
LGFLPDEPFELLEEEQRDERSVFRQLTPSLRRVSIVVTWISAFRLLDCGGHRNNQSIHYHKAWKIDFTLTFKAVISSLDES